jgi:hypothetical protein
MHRAFRPKPVSRSFRQDWNYAIRIARIPALRPATMIIALMPVLQQFVPREIISMDRIWRLWWASLLFIGAVVVLKLRCLAFIQEYQNFTDFSEKGYSHRWIVWEFFNNLDSLSGWKHVIHETKDKP